MRAIDSREVAGNAATARPVEAGAGPKPAERILVVPRDPGPLHDLAADASRPRDELDAVIDDLFGSATDERPGLFDVALLLVGAAMVLWAWLTEGPGVVAILGLGAILLAVALPARGALRAVTLRRAARRRIAAIGRGYPLDGGHPVTEGLADAYAELLQAADLPGPLPAEEARAAAHLAVVECAVLLDGKPPLASAHVRYAEVRAQAIRDLSADLLREHRDWLAQRAADAESRAERRATVVVGALEELQAAHRSGSLDQIGRLSRVLRRAAEDRSPSDEPAGP